MRRCPDWRHATFKRSRSEYRFISSDDAPDIYYALLEEDGELSVVLFEATQKALGILRFYNPMTVVTKVSR